MKAKIWYTIKNDAEVFWSIESNLVYKMMASSLDLLLGDKEVDLVATDVSHFTDRKKFPKSLKYEEGKELPGWGVSEGEFKGKIKWKKLTAEQKKALIYGMDLDFFLNRKRIANVYENSMAVFYVKKEESTNILKKVADKFDAELVEEREEK